MGVGFSRQRSDPQKTEVARTAAEIADQDEFIVVERAFVEVRCSNRFVLKNDGADAGFIERPLQSIERELVIFCRVRIRISDGSAYDDRTIKRPDFHLR